MPNGGHTQEQQRGIICSACKREFVEPHGRPVLCPTCYDQARATGVVLGYVKAWHEFKNPS